MTKSKLAQLLCVALATLLTGCRIISAGVITVAAVVGLAGYAVYKTGDAAVTGVGKAAQATGSALSSGSKSVATVIYANGEFKTAYPHPIRTVWMAANQALRRANFADVRGTFDALSGELTAVTRENVALAIKFKSLSPQSTEAGVRVGVTGDMKTSEIIHSLILRELPAPVLPPSAAVAQEVKP